MDIGPQQYGQWKLEKCCGSDICCDMWALAEDTGSYRLETICGPKKVCGMTQSSNFVPRCFLSCMPCACRKRWFNTLKDIPNVPRREYKLSYSYWALNGRSTASSDAVACLWRINVWHISGARETMEIRGMQLLPSRFWGDKMGEDETFGLLDQDNGACTREKRQTTEIPGAKLVEYQVLVSGLFERLEDICFIQSHAISETWLLNGSVALHCRF